MSSSHRSRAHILTSHRRLKEYKDTVGLYIFTLDLITNNYPVITGVEGLPYDCFALTPCSTSTGGVVVLASNSVLFVDQSGRRVILPVNGWPPRISDLPMPTLTPQEQTRDLLLEGSRFTFVDERTLFLFLRDGTVYPVELIQDGKTVSRLSMSPALAQTTIPAVVKRIGDDHVFVGSMVGPSVLLRTSQVEEEIVEEDVEMAPGPTVVDTANQMDMDDDEGKCSAVVRSPFCLTQPFQTSTGRRRTLTSLLQMALRTAPPILSKRELWCTSPCATQYRPMVPSLT